MEEEKELKVQKQEPQTIIIQQAKREANGIGIAGFVLSILAILLSCIPILNFILWVLGLIFSFIGIFRKPKGFALAGLIISLIGIVLIVLFLIGIVGLGALSEIASSQQI